MDINYLINIIEKNTKTIKQLNEQIDCLKEENKHIEENTRTIKQLNEQIDCLEEENKQFKDNFTKLGFYRESVIKPTPNVVQATNRVQIKRAQDPNNNENRVHIHGFKYNNLKETNIVNKTAKILDITTNHESHYGSTFKWTLDGIDNFPEVTQIKIYRGYGLHGIHETLDKITHKIKNIMLFSCYFIHTIESNALLSFCNNNGIELIMDFIGPSDEIYLRSMKYYPMDEHDKYVEMCKQADKERKSKNLITNKKNN